MQIWATPEESTQRALRRRGAKNAEKTNKECRKQGGQEFLTKGKKAMKRVTTANATQ
jgi:hypothetical protein